MGEWAEWKMIWNKEKEKKEPSRVSVRVLALISGRMSSVINKFAATEKGTFSSGQTTLSRNTKS